MNKKKGTPVTPLIPQETVESKIFFLRNEKIMLDNDLAMLYNVETKQLKRAVNRNLEISRPDKSQLRYFVFNAKS